MERISILFRNKPDAKPNPVKGFYTALALFLPLIVLNVLGQSAFGTLVLLGTLFASFGNIGTSYRMQARSIGAITVLGALITALGRIIGGPWWLEILEIFLAVFFSGLLAAYGRVAAAVGTLLTIILIISLSNRGGPTTALPAALGFLVGGAILMLFVFVFSLFQPHQSTPENEVPPTRPQLTLTTLTEQFTLASPLLRYALLRAVGATIAAVIGLNLGRLYPYWAVITVIICATDDHESSLFMTLQNVVATFLGALSAESIIVAVSNPLELGLIVVAVAFLAFTVKDMNYTFHVFFFTNLVLLLISIGTLGNAFVLWRIVATSIGAGIVFLIALLNQAWPDKERTGPHQANTTEMN